MSVEILQHLFKQQKSINVCINGFWQTGIIIKFLKPDSWKLLRKDGRIIWFKSTELTKPIEECEQ